MLKPSPLGEAVSGSSTALRVLLLPPQPWVSAETPEVETPTFERLFTELRKQNIAVEVLNPGGRLNLFAGRHSLYSGLDPIRALYVLCAGRSYDLIMAVTESPALPLLLLRRLARFRPPVIAVDIALSSGWRRRDAFLNKVVPRIDGLILLGSNQVSVVRQRWRTAAQVEFIPLQIDTDFFTPRAFNPRGALLAVGDDGGRDYKTLLTAIQGTSIGLTIKSRSPDVLAAAGPYVRPVPGRLNWQDYRQLYLEARCIALPLHPTAHAGGINALLEAMAMGLAITVSDSPGLRDYIVPNETALVVPPGDPVALRSAISRLMQDDELCRRLGAAARAWVLANCSYATVAQQTARMIRQVIATCTAQRS